MFLVMTSIDGHDSNAPITTNRCAKPPFKAGDFIWLKNEEGECLNQPYRVGGIHLESQCCWIQPGERWINWEQIEAFYPSQPWLKLLADQWLLTAALSGTPVGEKKIAHFIPKELRLLDPHQKAIIKWYLRQRKDVEAVSYSLVDEQESVLIWLGFKLTNPIDSNTQMMSGYQPTPEPVMRG